MSRCAHWWLPFLFTLALVHYFWAVSIGWNHPITDRHSFRQSQTAISAYYMVHEPWKLAYDTPLFGPPWSIPMEFPLYQWLAAAVVRGTGMGLDQAGRLLSVVFYLACLAPIYFILGAFRVLPQNRLAVLTLFLASPFYIFWSRTFLIETCGLFFCFAYLACVMAWRRGWFQWLACVFGVIAILVKITTFLPFVAAAGLFLWRDLLKPSVRRKQRDEWFLGNIIRAAILLGLPMACGIVWTHYADHLKEQNIFGQFLISKVLNHWNFGTLAQKTSLSVWKVILARAPDVLCQSRIFWFGGGLLVALLIRFCRRWKPMVMCVLLFLLSPLFFINLHFVHDYYMCANGVFLIAAVGFFVLGFLEQKKFRVVGIALLTGMVVLSIAKHYDEYFEIQNKDDAALVAFAHEIRDATLPETVNVYIGFDWNGSIPYYSERRALMIPEPSAQLPITTNLLKQAFEKLKGQKTQFLILSKPSAWSPEIITNLMKEAELPDPKILTYHYKG